MKTEQNARPDFDVLHGTDWYDPADGAIMQAQQRCMERLYDYNQTRPGEASRRQALLEQMLDAVGENCWIEPPLRANFGGRHLRLGNNVYINFNFTAVDDTWITLGDFVMIGPNVTVATASHPLDAALRRKGLQKNSPVVIEENVWIGAGAIVLPGVTIHRNAVIAAGCVVNRDIPEGMLAAGVPCRILGEAREKDRG